MVQDEAVTIDNDTNDDPFPSDTHAGFPLYKHELADDMVSRRIETFTYTGRVEDNTGHAT